MHHILDSASRMVVKQGLRLGLVAHGERSAALALVWAALLAPGQWTERELNAALKDLLADTASFLDTDHVELRRWLVDGGWLWRDGFGHEYRRQPATALPAAHGALAQAFAALAVPSWVAAQRRSDAEARAARRQAWRAASAAPA